MARRPPPGYCVHCTNRFDVLTWDHVFPGSWYPDSTPADLTRWKVPACEECNREYGRLEEDLLWRFGLCVDPQAAEASGIAAKVLRSMDPTAAKNERDRRHRARRREKAKRQILEAVEGFAKHALPGFDTNRTRVAVLVPADALKRLCDKIARGITFVQDGLLIGPGYRFDFFLDPTQAQPLRGALERFGRTEEQGPGVRVSRATPDQDRRACLFAFHLWGSFRAWGAVRPIS